MSVVSVPGRAWLSEQDCDLDAFRALTDRTTRLTDYPHAASVAENVLVYEGERLRDPEAFADYYANDVLALVSSAWLGPGYQVPSQVNVVTPGGAGQSPHRDYPLGFLSDAAAAAYPAHVHRLSPVLTLQGAVAHCDMPVASG